MPNSGPRGVLYIVWGNAHDPMLQRSIDSLRWYHPELPVHVERLADDLDPVHGLLLKSRMAEVSPFETTVYLDADTVVLGRLDFGFQQAERHGLACTICECPWARRYGGLQGDIVEYNTGVIFFHRRTKPLFDEWQRLTNTLDSSIRFLQDGRVRLMRYNDQAAFAGAVYELGPQPVVLPLNWNFRPGWQRSFFGPLKIWHDDMPVPEAVFQLSQYYQQPGAIIQFHEFQVQQQP